MNISKILIFFNKKTKINRNFDDTLIDQHIEIAQLVREARIQQKLTLKELSFISKIPEQIISSIENNDANLRPKYPFIRSILIKLEECLELKRNILVEKATRERETNKTEKKDFLFSKLDLINTWQGSVLYFFLLILSIFILKRYFILGVNVIEIQNIENKIIDK